MPGCGRCGHWGFGVVATGVPRGTRRPRLGAQLRGLGNNVTRTPAHVSSSLVARPERPGLGDAALAPPAGATRCSGGASNTQHSLVANCPEYETVRAPRPQIASFSNHSMRWGSGPVQGLGSKPRFTRVRIRGTTHDTRRVFSQVCGKRLPGRLTADSRGAPDRP